MEGFLTLPSENTAVVEDGKIEGEEDEGESSKQVEEESRSVGSESRKRVSEALIMCTLCTCFLVDSVTDNINVSMCQSAVSVVSSKEGRKSSSIKLLEEGESQMEGIAKSLEAGLVPFLASLYQTT